MSIGNRCSVQHDKWLTRSLENVSRGSIERGGYGTWLESRITQGVWADDSCTVVGDGSAARNGFAVFAHKESLRWIFLVFDVVKTTRCF